MALQQIPAVVTATPSKYFHGAKINTGTSASGNAFSISGIGTDSSKNIYVSYNGHGSFGFSVSKYDEFHNEIWTSKFTGPSYFTASALKVDSSGNVYVSGGFYTSSHSRPGFIKLNSSGVIQLQKVIGGTPSASDNGSANAIEVDSSGNIYIGGYIKSSAIGGNYKPYITKLNSSGTKIWDFIFSNVGSSSANPVNGITVNASGDVFATGQAFTTANTDKSAFLIKLSSSGTLTWQRWISEGTDIGQDSGSKPYVDSSDNIYIGVLSTTSPYQTASIVKYNTSGTIQWVRTLSNASRDTSGTSLAVNADGYIVMANALSTIGFIISAWNSSGTLQWQRKNKIKGNTIQSSLGTMGIHIDTFNNMYISAGTGNLAIETGVGDSGIAKLPADGSYPLYGTLMKLSIAYSTVDSGDTTEAAGTITTAADSLTSSTTSLTTSDFSVTTDTNTNGAIKADLK